MMTTLKRLFIAALLLTAPSLAFGGDSSIEPGKGVGKITLGAAREEVHQLLGNPSGQYKVSPQTDGEYWNSGGTHNSLRICYQGGHVIQISVTSSKFSTSDGLTTESPIDEVKKYFNELVRKNYFVHGSGGGLISYYDDQKRGVAFEFTAVDASTPVYHPYAILVHQSGKPVVPEPDEAPRNP